MLNKIEVLKSSPKLKPELKEGLTSITDSAHGNGFIINTTSTLWLLMQPIKVYWTFRWDIKQEYLAVCKEPWERKSLIGAQGWVWPSSLLCCNDTICSVYWRAIFSNFYPSREIPFLGRSIRIFSRACESYIHRNCLEVSEDLKSSSLRS